jgi:hypothetical protein
MYPRFSVICGVSSCISDADSRAWSPERRMSRLMRASGGV